jgi:hypothetical protein
MSPLRYMLIGFALVASLYGQQMKTSEKEPKGVIGRSYKDGLPVIWKFVNEAPTSQKRAALPWLTVISWKYDGSTNNGMPPKAVNDRMIALEQTIEQEVERKDFCAHAISKTGSNLKELIYYIHDREAFMQRFNAALKSRERYPIEITFYEDRDWKEHESARSLFNKGEPDGAANRNQPGGSQTNRTSSPPGSGR